MIDIKSWFFSRNYCPDKRSPEGLYAALPLPDYSRCLALRKRLAADNGWQRMMVRSSRFSVTADDGS